MRSETYRWKLVDDFIQNFNQHRASHFQPCERICVDESMIRWYGLGGHWINIGLPQYVAIDRKPENGCEIQNSACGGSGIFCRLKLVKTAEEDELNHEEDDDTTLLMNHGTAVLRELVEPWAHSQRVVCADSYFASVNTAEEMAKMGLRFIGVVKTATRKYPMAYLSNVELLSRGDRTGLIRKDADEQATMMAFVWMDRERRYFVANTSSLAEGEPYTRTRWRQISDEADAEPERVELTVAQPQACDIYYKTCGLIDQHNRCRQDTLKMEIKVETKRWWVRVGLGVFAMCVVDSWLLYSGATMTKEKQQDYYALLAEELIDNTFDRSGVPCSARRRGRVSDGTDNAESPSDLINPRSGQARAGIDIHLSPTKRSRKVDGVATNQCAQGRCRVCQKKTSISVHSVKTVKLPPTEIVGFAVQKLAGCAFQHT